MASTYTDIGTELMTTGENAGNWGTKTNTNLQILEEAVRGYISQSIAGGVQTTTLTYTDGTVGQSDAARNMIIALTGTITGNQTIHVTAKEKLWVIDNQTTGAYTVNIKVSGQTGVTWAATDKGTKILYCNGTDVIDTGISSTGAFDLDGNEFILDADADTSITADTDDQIDIKIAGADDFQFTANTFTAQSGSTIAAQALTATTVTASGIIKTDSTTAATSTTDGSLQTDGGLSVAADAVIGDDLKLLSDSAVLSFGADSDTTLTHTDGTGLTLNSTNKLLFRDTGLYINSSTDGQLDLVADTEIQIAATTIDINGAIAMDGAITGATNITLSGELDAATLDISGNADIDGTTNLDIVDIDGAVQLDATLTIGANDQGYDVILYGDTASANLTWDTSADDLILNGAARIVVPDSGLVLGSTAVTTTAAEINLIDGGASTGTTAVADADGILTNDGGTMRLTTAATFKTYFQEGVTISDLAADDISAGDAAVTIGNGSTSADVTIDSGDDVVIDAAGGNVEFKDAGTLQLSLDMDGTAGVQIIKLGVDSDDLVFQQYDGNEVMRINDNRKLCFFDDGGEHISSDGTDFTFASGNDINLTATTDINVPSGVGMTFGNDGEKIEGDGTDLTIAGNNINLTAVADVVIPANVGITFGSGEKIEGDSTDLTITSGAKINLTATSDVVIPANVGITFGSGEKIEGDSTDLTVTSGGALNLTATTDVVIPANVGITFGSGEKIEGDSTDLTVTSGAKINLSATSDVVIPNNVGIQFGGASEKIEGDGTDLTISANNLTVDAAADIILDAAGNNVIFKSGGTSILDISNSSSDAVITASVQDKDIIFKGDDGGSAVTALTLDMSAGGIATFSAAANVTQQAITSSSNAVAWDASDKPNAYHITTENTTFSAPSNAVEGAFICVEINYNGSHSIGWNTIFEFAASTEPTETATDAKTDIHVFRYNGAIWQEVGRTMNLSES